jgi:hypothetical protein
MGWSTWIKDGMSMVMYTFLGLPRAASKAICPMRRDARSVIKRVARASFPFSPVVRASCLTYCGCNATFNVLRIKRNRQLAHQALRILADHYQIYVRFAAFLESDLGRDQVSILARSMARITETTGRMFAYRSKIFRRATIGDEYPATFLDGELARCQKAIY